jgi:hypothetical protein
LIFAFVHPSGPMFPLAIMGAAYAIVGALNLFRAGRSERAYVLVAGLLLLAIAIVFGLGGFPIEVTGMVGICAPVAVLFPLGLYQALRG